VCVCVCVCVCKPEGRRSEGVLEEDRLSCEERDGWVNPAEVSRDLIVLHMAEIF